MVSKSTGSLVFVDSSLEQYEHLLDGVVAGAEVVLVDAQRDGVEQITQVLQGRRDVQSIHVLSHAVPGVLQLGAARVTVSSLPQYAPSIRQWTQSLAANAAVLLYGCRLAANDAGRSLVAQLGQLTQVAIAASETLTGHSSQGGDWNLSVRTGPITAPLALRPETLATYPSVLALFDWSSPEIDWPDGESGTTVFEDVDGTGVDFTIDISATNGVTFGQAPSGVGPLTPDDIQFLQGGETTIPTALHITMDNATRDEDAVTTTVSFSQALRGIKFQIFDIDEAILIDGWQDEVEIIGFRGDTVVQPRLIASTNAAYDINGNVAVGIRSTPNEGPTSAEATLSVEFDSRITSYQVIYRNGPDAIANPGEQGIGILSNIFFNEPDSDTNRAPDTDDVRLRVDPGETRRIPDLAGTDPDGTVERFRITSLPAAAQGTLFLGSPDRRGEAIEEGDRIRANQINRVFFQADNNFTGTTFEYASIDNEGREDPTPGVVRLRPGGNSGDPDNERPETKDVLNRVDADSIKGLRRLGGSDPDGTVEQFRIISLPPARQGTLFLGNPDRGGVAVEEGQEIPASQINRLFFQSTAGFTGTSFQYAAIDDEGAIDRSPATVELRPTRTPSDNSPPDTVSFQALDVPSNDVTRLTGFEVSDPDGDDTVETFTILRLPPQRLGTLYIGDPERGGTPVVAGEEISVDQLGQIFLETTEAFTPGEEDVTIRFRYTATDNRGELDESPALVTVVPVLAPARRCPRGETLNGTRQNDRLTGGDGRDSIFGNAGNDQLRGRGCDDLINGGQGNDTMLGDAGNDTLDGGAGTDSADGGAGQDLLFGGADNDRLDGGRGDDIARGGQGRDRISGGAGNDELVGRSDDDEILGDDGDDAIVGGRGDDRLQGGDGNDQIDAKSGDDRVRGDKGSDRIFGGRGEDDLTGRLGSDRISAGSGADRVDGSAGADRVRGELGDDFIQGGAGADRLKGNNGEDRIRAGKGKDIVNGGQDNDFLSGRNGDDRLRASSGDDRLRGNGLSDLMIGNRGDDRLNAGTGDDELIGGLGADILVGGRGGDVFTYRTVRDGAEVGDRIRRFEAGQDLIDLSKLLNKGQFSEDGAFRRYVSLSQSRGNTLLEINIDGDTGENFKPFATITGVAPSEIGRSSFIV